MLIFWSLFLSANVSVNIFDSSIKSTNSAAVISSLFEQFLISGRVAGNETPPIFAALLMKDLGATEDRRADLFCSFLSLLLITGLRSFPAEANFSLFFSTASSTVLKEDTIKPSNGSASKRRRIQSGADGRPDNGDKEHCAHTEPSVEAL